MLLRTGLRSGEVAGKGASARIVVLRSGVSMRYYHSTGTTLKRSGYKYALRPDLRDSKITLQDKEKNYELWKKQVVENSKWYYSVDPDQLEKRWTKMIATRSYNLPQGGFRMGILEVMLKIAKKPSHLRIVQQALTLMQQKDTNLVIPESFISLYCKSATRINAPELGLSFIQMPWFQTRPAMSGVVTLLKKYAEDAETYFIDRVRVGKATAIPDHLKLPETADVEPEIRDKKEAKQLDLWLSSFTETYKELRNDRHPWHTSVGWRQYSPVIRFYASVGDVDSALVIYKKFGKADPKAIRDICFSLIYQGRAQEAVEVLKGVSEEIYKEGLTTAQIASSLAVNDIDAAKAVFKGLPEITLDHFHTHFGVETRKKALQTIANQLKSEGTPIPQDALDYLPTLTEPTQEL